MLQKRLPLPRLDTMWYNTDIRTCIREVVCLYKPARESAVKRSLDTV